MARATADQITGIYRELLGRDPDAGGAQHYSRYDPNFIRSDILKSTEYGQRQASIAQKTAADQAARDQAAAAETAKRQQLESEVGGLFGELGEQYKNMQNPVDIYNEALGQLGIND